MNKSDLVEAVASQLESSRADAQRSLEAVLAAITSGVQKDEKVQITGFGTFAKKTRAARDGINPATKEKIRIKESTTCGFKPAAALKE
ncbi:MAG: DNA-binding protein HU-beta, partial [Phycisphaerales bacterium]